MAAAQLAKSELLNNVIGRYIEVDPCPMLMVQPTDDNAIAYSKERIGPMIRDTPSLRKLVKDPNQKIQEILSVIKLFRRLYCICWNISRKQISFQTDSITFVR